MRTVTITLEKINNSNDILYISRVADVFTSKAIHKGNKLLFNVAVHAYQRISILKR